MRKFRVQHGWFFYALWAGWTCAVLAAYYRQVGQVFHLGLRGWVSDNASLNEVLVFLRLLFQANDFPWAGQAAMRTLQAIVGAGLTSIAATGLGWGFTRLIGWHGSSRVESLLYRATSGCGLLSTLCFGLAGFGFFQPEPLRWMILALAVATCAAWIFTQAKRRRDLRTITIRTFHFSRSEWLWSGIATLAMVFALLGALAPESEFDALSYHLWLPKLWLSQGHPVDLIQEYTSLYPLTWELVFTGGMVWGGAVAAKLLHFTCYLMGGLLVYRWTQRDFPGASPWLATALFMTIPTVLWEATTAYIDNALALVCGLTLYALLRFVESKDWRWFALGVLEMGLALASKHLALGVLAPAALGLLLAVWRREGSLRRAVLAAGGLTFISVLIASPWYLRSASASGNPFFPAMYSVFGAHPPLRWDSLAQTQLDHFLAHFGRERTPVNLATLPWDITLHAASYGGTLGPLFLILLPGLVGLPRHPSRNWLAGFILLFLAFWASPLSSFQMRLLLPLAPILAVLAGEAASYAVTGLCAHMARPRLRARLSPLLSAALAGLLLLNLPPFISLHEADRVGYLGWLTHVTHRPPAAVVLGLQSEEDYLRKVVPSFSAWEYINSHLPPDALVLTFSDGDHYYSQRARLWSDSVLARPAVWGAPAGKESQALFALRELGVSHILFDQEILRRVAPYELAIAQPEFIAAHLTLLYQDQRYTLLALRQANRMPG